MRPRKSLVLALSLLLAALWLAPALAQKDVTGIRDAAFGDTPPQPVPFPHDAHNAKAGLTDCSFCHHVYDRNGQKLKDTASVSQRCSDCHRVRPMGDDFAPALMNAFHKRCQDCHRERGKGPTDCAQCHKK